jgi:hypothetical protein
VGKVRDANTSRGSKCCGVGGRVEWMARARSRRACSHRDPRDRSWRRIETRTGVRAETNTKWKMIAMSICLVLKKLPKVPKTNCTQVTVQAYSPRTLTESLFEDKLNMTSFRGRADQRYAPDFRVWGVFVFPRKHSYFWFRDRPEPAVLKADVPYF